MRARGRAACTVGEAGSEPGHGQTAKQVRIEYEPGIVSALGDRPQGAHQQEVVLQRRLALLGVSWRDAVRTQAYTVQNIGHLVGETMAARGACAGGLVWHYARPPVIGLEYEMDVRGVRTELRIE